MWNAWGLAWGDSWGSSWGPLHEVEERPNEYRGNGRRAQFSDATDSDIIQLVHDKWEAIESAAEPARQVVDQEPPAPASAEQAFSGISSQQQGFEDAVDNGGAAILFPIAPAALPETIEADAGQLHADQRIKEMRQANSLAMLLLLAEL